VNKKGRGGNSILRHWGKRCVGLSFFGVRGYDLLRLKREEKGKGGKGRERPEVPRVAVAVSVYNSPDSGKEKRKLKHAIHSWQGKRREKGGRRVPSAWKRSVKKAAAGRKCGATWRKERDGRLPPSVADSEGEEGEEGEFRCPADVKKRTFVVSGGGLNLTAILRGGKTACAFYVFPLRWGLVISVELIRRKEPTR